MPIELKPRPDHWPRVEMSLYSVRRVRALFEAGRQAARDLANLDARGVAQSARELVADDLDNHFLFAGAAQPDWVLPLRSELTRLNDDEVATFSLSFETWASLLQGARDPDAEFLAAALEENPAIWQRGWMLAAVGTRKALSLVADFARRHGRQSELEDLGIEVPAQGPARWRFGMQRRAIQVGPYYGPREDVGRQSNPVGLPLAATANEPGTSLIRWHYLSVNTFHLRGDMACLHQVFVGRMHLVGPALDGGWTLFCDVARHDGKYSARSLRHEDEDATGLDEDNDTAGGVALAHLLHFDDKLLYSNGHILRTPGVEGVLGGPPIGLYPNPKCPNCGRLMFHVLTVSCRIRDYGEGFRSLFACEDCRLAACHATHWN